MSEGFAILLQDETGQNSFPESISADELFSGLTPRQKEDLALIMVREEFLPKTPVFASGEVPSSIYAHRSGRAILLHDKSLVNLDYSCPVESDRLYGTVEALLESPYEISMKTLSSCEFDMIGREDFFRFIRDRPLLCYRLVEILSRMHQHALQKIRSH